jgi:hypothetical protein
MTEEVLQKIDKTVRTRFAKELDDRVSPRRPITASFRCSTESKINRWNVDLYTPRVGIGFDLDAVGVLPLAVAACGIPRF